MSPEQVEGRAVGAAKRHLQPGRGPRLRRDRRSAVRRRVGSHAGLPRGPRPAEPGPGTGRGPWADRPLHGQGPRPAAHRRRDLARRAGRGRYLARCPRRLTRTFIALPDLPAAVPTPAVVNPDSRRRSQTRVGTVCPARLPGRPVARAARVGAAGWPGRTVPLSGRAPMVVGLLAASRGGIARRRDRRRIGRRWLRPDRQQPYPPGMYTSPMPPPRRKPRPDHVTDRGRDCIHASAPPRPRATPRPPPTSPSRVRTSASQTGARHPADQRPRRPRPKATTSSARPRPQAVARRPRPGPVSVQSRPS